MHKCQNCSEPATVHLTEKALNKPTIKTHLCEPCAKSPGGLQASVSGLIDKIEKLEQTAKELEILTYNLTKITKQAGDGCWWTSNLRISPDYSAVEHTWDEHPHNGDAYNHQYHDLTMEETAKRLQEIYNDNRKIVKNALKDKLVEKMAEDELVRHGL